MALRSESRQIGEHKYHVILLPTSEATGAAFRLANVAGPAVQAYRDGGVVAAGKFLQELKHDDLVYFTDLFKPRTTIEAKGKKIGLAAVYEEHFVGDMKSLFKWLAFCVEINFSSFFPEIAAYVKKHVGEDAGEKAETEGSPSS
jgi:tail assembly chaperone